MHRNRTATTATPISSQSSIPASPHTSMSAMASSSSDASRPSVRIGISGWRYEGWRGVFYPKGLAQRRELEFASRQVQTVEINGSHYSLQTVESYRAWHAATPGDFLFSVKGPRYLTHMLRFRDDGARVGRVLGQRAE